MLKHRILVYVGMCRYSISIHDEIHFLCEEKHALRLALAMQVANLWTRAMFAFKLGMLDLPQVCPSAHLPLPPCLHASRCWHLSTLCLLATLHLVFSLSFIGCRSTHLCTYFSLLCSPLRSSLLSKSTVVYGKTFAMNAKLLPILDYFRLIKFLMVFSLDLLSQITKNILCRSLKLPSFQTKFQLLPSKQGRLGGSRGLLKNFIVLKIGKIRKKHLLNTSHL